MPPHTSLERGCSSGTFDGGRLRLYESRRAEGRGEPGTILALGADGITIAAGDGAVRAGKARVDGTREKIAATEAAAALGLAVGSRLGG